jgi:hypothetical protein
MTHSQILSGLPLSWHFTFSYWFIVFTDWRMSTMPVMFNSHLFIFRMDTLKYCVPDAIILFLSQLMHTQQCVLRQWKHHNRLPVQCQQTNKQSPWSESVSELYRPSDRRLSAKWMPTFADRGCHMISVMDPYGRILGFLDRSCHFSIK